MMFNKLIVLTLFLITGLITLVWGQNTGLIPVPIFTNAGVQSSVAYDSTSGLYTYNYTITNPTTNTGEIWSIDIDITKPIDSTYPSSNGLMIPHGFITDTFDEEIADFDGDFVPMVPVGINVPSGWGGSIRARGFAGFSSRTGTPHIHAGETKGGFQIISRGLPTIRNIEIEPWWVMVEDGPASDESAVTARSVEKSLKFSTSTIGPSAVFPGNYEHWNMIRDNLNQAIQLGWISDATLANTLVTQLATARQAEDSRNGTLAKTRLRVLFDTISQSTLSQRRQEVYDLLILNVQKLIEYTPDTPIPFEPKAIISPESITLSLGDTYTLTVTIINLGDNNKPLSGFPIMIKLTEWL